MKKICLVLAALMISTILPTIQAEASIVMGDGTTAFTHTNFDAIVYWRVYSPVDINSPAGSVSDFTYCYQVYNSGIGSDFMLTQFGIANPAGAPITGGGYSTTMNFSGLTGSLAPTNEDYGGETCALWSFANPNKIPRGSSSYFLYFTSPYEPTMVPGGIQAGQPNAEAPVPGPAPEPATMAMLGMGLVGFAGSIRRKFMA